jgi:pimeloyl-ACP methyl ester carboxylesterase
MARAEIKGIGIEYEVIGDGGPLAIITPGGRFSKDYGGIRELAQALAKGGLSVIIWDRPNCGASDMCFEYETESKMNADVLAGLVQHQNRGPALVIGGSAGSRVSLISASRHPEVVSKLFALWVSGGPISLAMLGGHYTGGSGVACSMGGMQAVADLAEWKESLTRNPRNRDYLLSQNPDTFIETMQRWCASFFPTPGSPVPGMTPEDFKKLTMPVTVVRSGKSDIFHTRKTSEEVHALIPHSKLIEPPWNDTEWNDRMNAQGQGESLFAHWHELAPYILEFARG